MKIYFAGSIRGGRSNASIYRSLIGYLSSLGEVLTEHVGDALLTEAGDDGPSDREIHDRDLAWLIASDALVAEVSTLSLGVGYEIGYAVALHKPVLCLHQSRSERRLSAMIAGSPYIVSAEYSDLNGAEEIIDSFFKEKALSSSR